MTIGYLERDDESAEFFDHAAGGVLALRRCGCGEWASPERRSCPECGSARLSWVPVPGRGTLVTWTLVHGARPAPEEAPSLTAVGIVEVAEGPWVTGRLDASPDGLSVGMPMEVAFDRHPEGETVPVWRHSKGEG